MNLGRTLFCCEPDGLADDVLLDEPSRIVGGGKETTNDPLCPKPFLTSNRGPLGGSVDHHVARPRQPARGGVGLLNRTSCKIKALRGRRRGRGGDDDEVERG